MHTKSPRPDPLQTIHKLIQERYSDAKTVFWAGSASTGNHTTASDLDLVIVHENLPNAYREAFFYNGWPIDAFVHNMESLRYFFEQARSGNGIAGLVYMIINAVEVTQPNDFSLSITQLAQDFFQAGPTLWNQGRIDKERFLTTDALEDIKFPRSRAEQIASAAHLYEPLSQFYFRAQGKWCASGKSAIRDLQRANPQLAAEFIQAFEAVFQKGNTEALELLVEKILAPYGGFIWDGFHSEAIIEAKNA